MTFTDPGDVPHVVTGDTGLANWANAIRDRTPQRFETESHRDAAVPTPSDGYVAFITRDLTITTWNGTRWLVEDVATRTYEPTLNVGTVPIQDLTINEARYVRRGDSCRAWISVMQKDFDDNLHSELGLSLPVAASGHVSGSNLGLGVVASNSGNYVCEVIYRPATGFVGFRYISGEIIGSTLPLSVVVGEGLFVIVNCTFEYTIA